MEVEVGAHAQQHDAERIEENEHAEFGIQVALPVPPDLQAEVQLVTSSGRDGKLTLQPGGTEAS